jgi:hypothetical protein
MGTLCEFFCGAATQRGSWPPHSRGFLDHIQWHTAVGRTPLDAWSVRRKDLYLTTHNTHNRQTSMPPVEFEPTISAGERPQTYALERAATGTGTLCEYLCKFMITSLHFFLKWEIFQTKVVEKMKTHILHWLFFPPENRACHEMWENMVQLDWPHDHIARRMRFAYWITKATDTHLECVILIDFPQQEMWRERASLLLLYVHRLSCLD